VVTNTSAFTLPLITLNAMILFLLPLAVAIFAGESVAGEAGWGSLRYVLIRAVPRWRVLGAKAAMAGALSLGVVIATAVVALAAGVVAFGWRPLTVIDLQHTSPLHIASATFSPWQSTGRLALTVGFMACTLASTFGFALFLSTLTDRAFGAVAGGVGLGVVSRAIDNVPGLHALSPWLPVTDSGTSAWTGLFFLPAQTSGIWHALGVQGAYLVVFLGAAWLWFIRSDVLT